MISQPLRQAHCDCCWLRAGQVAFVVHTFMDTSHIDYRYFIWIFFFGMANSMVNPIIYGACLFCRTRSKKHTERYI